MLPEYEMGFLMRAKLNGQKIIDSIEPEEGLQESSIMESIYVIRQFKAYVEFVEKGFIEVDKIDIHGQMFSKKFEIWFQIDEYELIAGT